MSDDKRLMIFCYNAVICSCRLTSLLSSVRSFSNKYNRHCISYPRGDFSIYTCMCFPSYTDMLQNIIIHLSIFTLYSLHLCLFLVFFDIYFVVLVSTEAVFYMEREVLHNKL